MVLVEVSSFDGAKSPVGVVSSMMLARAGAVSSRVEPAAISSIIAASTSIAGDGPSSRLNLTIPSPFVVLLAPLH